MSAATASAAYVSKHAATAIPVETGAPVAEIAPRVVAARTFNPSRDVPAELTNIAQWIGWRYVTRPGKAKSDKVPTCPRTGRNLEWQKECNWLTYETAVAAYNANPALSGIGLVLRPENGLVGIDMDHALDLGTGEFAEWAREHVGDVNTYTEISPGGEGFRMFTLGELPAVCRKKVGNREIYNDGRWLTITGNVFNDSPIVRNDAAVERYRTAMDAEANARRAPGVALVLAITEQEVAELRSALNMLDPDNYETWIFVGLALYSLGAVGLELWLTWSQGSAKWQPSDRQKWETFAGSGIGHKAIFARAQREGWNNPLAGGVSTLPMRAEVARCAAIQACSLRAVPLDLQSAALAPPEFVIDKLLPRRLVTLFAGNGGVGKSTLALVMGVCKAAGREFLGFLAPRGSVVYVSLEDEPSIVRWRLRVICKALGVSPDEIRDTLRIVDGSDGDAALVVERNDGGVRKIVPTANLDALRKLTAAAELIIVDNCSDAYEAEENVRRQVRAFVRLLTGIAKANNGALVLLAHVDKHSAKHGGQGQTFSGSSAWNNSVRSRLALVERDGAIELAHEKSNFGKKADPIRLTFGADGMLMPANGAIVESGDDVMLLRCMSAATTRGDVIGTARTGAGSTFAAVRTLPGFPSALRAADRFWRVLGRLEAAGSIVREEYRTADYKTRTKWISANPPEPALAD